MRIKSALMGLLIGAGLATSLAPYDALACGESLFRIGKGVTHRAQVAPLPGNVLVVAAGQEGHDLAEVLAAAGHDVQVIDGTALLAQELRTGDYDVVLALFSDRESVEAQVSASGSRAVFLPVTLDDDEAAVAEQAYRRHLSGDGNLGHFLKTIHRVLKEQLAS